MMITQYNYAKNKWEKFYSEEEYETISKKIMTITDAGFELSVQNCQMEQKLKKIEKIVLIKCKTCQENMPRYCDREKFEYCKFGKILQILESEK